MPKIEEAQGINDDMLLYQIDKKQFKKDIGFNIRFKRHASNLSLEELSELIGISPQFLRLVETGKRGTTLINLIKLSCIFSCSIDELVNKTEYEKSNSMTNPKQHIYRIISNLSILNLHCSEDITFLIEFMKVFKVYISEKQGKVEGGVLNE